MRAASRCSCANKRNNSCNLYALSSGTSNLLSKQAPGLSRDLHLEPITSQRETKRRGQKLPTRWRGGGVRDARPPVSRVGCATRVTRQTHTWPRVKNEGWCPGGAARACVRVPARRVDIKQLYSISCECRVYIIQYRVDRLKPYRVSSA